jgi:hypothetical protein
MSCLTRSCLCPHRIALVSRGVFVVLLVILTAVPAHAAGLSSVPAPSVPEGALASGYAVIVTNNRSLDVDRPDLHYADDDGAKYAELFAEMLSASHVVLLTQFDAESRLLYPEWAARALVPSAASLLAATAQFADAARHDQALGRKPVVYVVYAGHGDMDGGQGYIELADGRFYSRQLDTQLLSLLDGLPVHLVLDSCNSYFMLNPRGPGQRRWASQSKVQSVLEHHPNVGAIISTSAEAVTYEWSELQSGIFSYELRSGLRGAADANGDGKISYLELAAFVDTANRALVNDIYRPRVYAHGPAGSPDADFFASCDTQVRELWIPAGADRRFTLRDRHGVRLLDVHREQGGALRLRLPTTGQVDVYERVAGDEGRPIVLLRTISDGETRAAVALEEVVAQPPALAERGERPVFAALFAAPFGAQAVSEYAARRADADPEQGFGVSKRDAERLRQHLETAAMLERDDRVRTSVIGVAVGVIVGYELLDVVAKRDDPFPLSSKGVLAGVCGLLGAVGIVSAVATRVPAADLHEDYETMDSSNERQRTVNVAATETRFAALANRQATWRAITASGLIVGGLALANVQLVLSPRADGARYFLRAALGTGIAGLGVYNLVALRQPTERLFNLYEEGSYESKTPRTAAWAATPVLGLAPGGFVLGLAGNF